MHTGRLTKDIQIPLECAERWTDKILSELREHCVDDRCAVAGSIRRRCPYVHDIDLVMTPLSGGHHEAIKRRCLQSAAVIRNGDLNFTFELENRVQVDIFFAQRSQRTLFGTEPENWGSLLLCRTGPRAFNTQLAMRAQDLGMQWNPYYGLYRAGQCLASATEEDMFKLLKLKFIPPEARR